MRPGNLVKEFRCVRAGSVRLCAMSSMNVCLYVCKADYFKLEKGEKRILSECNC